MKIGWNDLRREPFRLLFPVGALFGCVGVQAWRSLLVVPRCRVSSRQPGPASNASSVIWP